MANTILDRIQKGARVYNKLITENGLTATQIFGFDPENDPFVFINQSGSYVFGEKATFANSNFDDTKVSILPDSPLCNALREMPQMAAFHDKLVFFYCPSLPNWTLDEKLTANDVYYLDFYLSSLAKIQVGNAFLLLSVDTDQLLINTENVVLLECNPLIPLKERDYVFAEFMAGFKEVNAPNVFA